MKGLIEPYNPGWKTAFDQLKAVLLTALHIPDLAIEHVGSTAIPGLCAKPVLDIDIVLPDGDLLSTISQRLESLGYINRGDQGIPGRYAFRQSSLRTPLFPGADVWQEHHLYVCIDGSLSLKNHLVFRNALLQDAGLVKEYTDLKWQLIHQPGITRAIYGQGKTFFVLKVLARYGFTPEELEEIRRANE